MDNRRKQLNDFFCDVQIKALRQIEISTGNKDDALDILQEAMVRLAQKYADQREEWPKLFQRIIQNLIRDWYRRKKVRSIIIWWQQKEGNHEKENDDQLNGIDADRRFAPDKSKEHDDISEHIVTALQELPQRQQQAFMLRAFWGYDTEETAFAMQCSQGSVKTHYSRAIGKLKLLLNEIDL